MKWAEFAKLLVPVVVAAIPGAAPLAPVLLPLMLAGITEAQALHGSDKPQEKNAHLVNVVALGAAAATATGKVNIDPALATTIAQSVIATVDAAHMVVKNLQPAAAA